MTAPVDELAAVAAQLAARVREDGPDENAAWLARVLPDPADRDRLNFVLAAAVSVDRPWRELVAWVGADLADLAAGSAGNVVELHPTDDDEDQGVDEMSVRIAVGRVLDTVPIDIDRSDKLDRLLASPAPRLSPAELTAVVAELDRRKVGTRRIAAGLGISMRMVERVRAGYVRTRKRWAA